MIDISGDNMLLCTGCAACKNICPTGAINMVENAEGFLYPKIDAAHCVGCGQCENVCQIFHRDKPADRKAVMFAAVNKDNDVLGQSSSGGVFAALADIIAQRDGIIVGCLFDESMTAVHKAVEARKGYSQFQGSKYVQSDIGGTYIEVEKYLQEGRRVLFTGTPCQVKGLQLFLGKDCANLLTADLICHGVPSPKLWHEHLSYLEKKNGKEIVSYRFRGKYRVGWSLYYYYYYKGEKKPKHGYAQLDPFYAAFLNGENYRECCYRCNFAALPRVGDFTIGDYWGVEKHHHGLQANRGVSLLLLNTAKAKDLLGDIEARMEITPTKEEWATEYNHNLVRPTERPEERDRFYINVFNDAARWENEFYHSPDVIKLRIKSKIPVTIKRLIKKLIGRP